MSIRFYDPDGIEFFDKASGKHLKLVTEKDYCYEGWLVYKHTDGQWVTLRKATDEDKAKIKKAQLDARCLIRVTEMPQEKEKSVVSIPQETQESTDNDYQILTPQEAVQQLADLLGKKVSLFGKTAEPRK
jgi:Spy/CpxP family protein refolding chaperone